MTATVVRTISSPQATVYDDPHRFRVLIAGRRFGKTHLGGLLCLEAAIKWPDSESWYLAQTLKNGRMYGWAKLKAIIPREYLMSAPHETDMVLKLRNGSVIRVMGREEPDNLRGGGLRRIVNDEFAVQEGKDRGRATWETVLRPMLSDTMGDAIFISTPKGLNFAYDFYLRGADPAFPEWASWQFTTLQGGRVSAEEVASAKADMDPRSYKQEYEASFEALGNRVYDYFDRTLNVAEVQDTGGDIYVGMDFNISPMSAVIGVKAADELHILDALAINTSNTEEMADELKRRYHNRRVIVCPDPSGNSRSTKAPAGQTDFTILRKFFTVSAPSAAPPIVDRVNNVQANLLAADGRRRLKIHPKAAHLIRSLDGLTYKEDTRLPDKDSGLDHMSDALGYLCWDQFRRLGVVATSRPFAM